jgi:hypothetical protein
MTRAGLVAWCAVALAWRLLLAARTPVPSEDGASYLWMAQRFAAGEAGAALGEVFPPGLPLLVAPWVALGADPLRAAQVVLALAGALWVVAVARLAERLVAGSGPWAAAIAAFFGQAARACAEVYTEPAFLLPATLAAHAGADRRWWRLGVLAGAAAWLRPEALALPVGFALAAPRAAWRALVPAAAAVVALAAWRATGGSAFELVPKLGFVWRASVPGGGASWWDNLLGLPGAWLEAFGVAGVLALPAVLRLPRGAGPLLLALGGGVLAVVLYVPRQRFLLSWSFVVVPLAAAALARLPRGVALAACGAAVAGGAWKGLHTVDPDRLAERAVGEWLAGELAPNERVTGDLARVIWYAGRQPPPPRHFAAHELMLQALEPGVRFVVLGGRRATTPVVAQALSEQYREVAPAVGDDVAPLLATRPIRVLRRND